MPIRTVRSQSNSPCTNGITMYTKPAVVSPRRMMWHTLGCASFPPSAASRRRRAMAVGSLISAGERILIATFSPVFVSCARYTKLMPPSPTFFTT